MADRFDESVRRRTDVPFSHHQEVAALPPDEADAVLEEAARDGLSHECRTP